MGLWLVDVISLFCSFMMLFPHNLWQLEAAGSNYYYIYVYIWSLWQSFTTLDTTPGCDVSFWMRSGYFFNCWIWTSTKWCKIFFFHPDSPSACERVAGSPGSSHPSYLSSMTMMTCRSHQLALKCIKVPKLCKRTSSIWPWIGWLTYDLHLIQSWRITLDFLWSFSPGHTCPGCVDLIVA